MSRALFLHFRAPLTHRNRRKLILPILNDICYHNSHSRSPMTIRCAFTPFAAILAGLALARGPVSAATFYVWQANSNPAPPYTNWASAATNIQDAVDLAAAGDLVLVTNGIFTVGARVVNGTTNRVAVGAEIVVQSVNGPAATWIVGSGTNGVVRCAYVGSNAVLSGFTLTNGRAGNFGGGALCEGTALVTNSILTGSYAYQNGGGAYSGTLKNCLLTNNVARAGWGGAAFGANLNECS